MEVKVNKKDYLNNIYEKIAQAIDISEQLFDQAEDKYNKLGIWMDRETPDYKITIYPQGSFALGTVVKPVSDKDDYDLDLVCEFDKDYGFDAQSLKIKIVKPLLDRYDEAIRIKEKKRCWQAIYKSSSNFHMDIIPAINRVVYISITDKNEENSSYKYIGSNPKGYIDWFNKRKETRYKAIKEAYEKDPSRRFMAKVEPIKEYRLKTPLQKSIQILKRHRDILYQDDPDHLAPISIIITTIAAQLYNNEDNIYDTLKTILDNAKTYVESCKKNGTYYIENPSYTGIQKENFADKWNDNPERAEAFFDWLDQAQTNLINCVDAFDSKADIGSLLSVSLGENLIKRVFSEYDAPIEKLISEKTSESDFALIPIKTRMLMSVPHRENPPWHIPKGFRIFIKATITDPRTGTTYEYENDGEPLEKGLSIKFTAFFSVKKPYRLKWQVVNTGNEAKFKQCLRGGFEESDFASNTRSESTEYSGSHYIQCFLIKKNQCIAKSNIFIVNIK